MSKTNKKTQNNQPKGRNSNQKRKQQNNPNRPQQGKNGGSRKKQASVAAAYATGTLGSSPKVKSTRDHCNIVHREFLGNVSGSVLFTILLTLAINPGIAATFPWLSIQAQCWEQYRFKKLRFHYLTRTGSNTAGSVLMSPDYDASDAAPSNEVVQSTYEGTAEDAPWKDIILTLKTNLMSGTTQRKFVRTGALLPNQDIKLYDAATVFISTVDASAPAAWGKLWVEYDVDLFIPQLPPTGPSIAASASGLTGTTVAFAASGQVISGNLISSLVGNVLSLQNLIIGQKYLIQWGATTVSAGNAAVPSALVGITLGIVSRANAAGDITGGTYIATANVGSITLTSGGNTTNPVVEISTVVLAF